MTESPKRFQKGESFNIGFGEWLATLSVAARNASLTKTKSIGKAGIDGNISRQPGFRLSSKPSKRGQLSARVAGRTVPTDQRSTALRITQHRDWEIIGFLLPRLPTCLMF